MIILPFLNIEFIVLIVNFVSFVFIFFYAFYLFRVEKNLKYKSKQLSQDTEEIISKANKKALEIISKSEYISADMKGDLSLSIKEFIDGLKFDNEEFFKQLEREYVKSSAQFVNKIKNENEAQLNSFVRAIKDETAKVETEIDDKLTHGFAEIDEQINKYKDKRIAEVEARLKERLKLDAIEVLAGSIPLEIQEKAILNVISRLKAEKALL